MIRGWRHTTDPTSVRVRIRRGGGGGGGGDGGVVLTMTIPNPFQHVVCVDLDAAHVELDRADLVGDFGGESMSGMNVYICSVGVEGCSAPDLLLVFFFVFEPLDYLQLGCEEGLR